ncbi:FK506-binding protein 15 isoform X2 [Hippocampus comes]|uniref:FK506-binding protein 15 isoform X1 n=2 Tax=Hippocampus comes TaxID=109280 RepID=UPI00094F2FF0|nr:PREDICTED: FK506-binding protein 15 isoform X1 [Hippocampus comes]XP_019716515.1 PREDICTED: FK506-binding protein 15 isoform X2 [Hippocampus comes]
MFGGDDEDGDFLSPTGGAKLASLFGLDEETSQGNDSFHYTAPKQPRKSSNPVSGIQTAAPSPGPLEVLFAVAVHAFRYIKGQYVKQGKLGAAILGNHTSKEYKLLLYLSQQKPVTSAKIHIDFIFTVQSNNYCTFYDDQRQNWSLMFESEKSSSEFCKEVCLAKANSCNVFDAVLTQDLSPGEGQAVQYGDSLEVAYRGWLLQNHTIGQMFDSNQNKDKLLRLKIGAGKVIQGWEKGVLGMKKAGCRLIVVPPNLAYGSQGLPDRVPANSTLIFEAALRRVKISKECGSDQASASSRDSGTLSPAPSVENLTTEPPVQTAALDSGRPGETPQHAKSNSLSEQLTTTDPTKAKLISRMAKMGQPMLPFLTCQPESSDSELEDTTTGRVKNLPLAPSPVQITSAAPVQAHVLPHPYPALPTNVLPNLTNIAAQPGLLGNPHTFQTSVPMNQLQSVSQVYPTRIPCIGSNDVTSFLMIETRQQNTEIRLAVGKVADKVDQLASKIDDLQRQGTVSLGLSGISMESSMIMQNVQRIIQENECLKKDIFEKGSRIEEQNHKISELFNQSQRYMEQNNTLLEKRNDSLQSSSERSQAKLLQAEQDKIQLREELASTAAQLSQVQLEALSHQQKVLELQTKLTTSLLDCKSHTKHISDLESQLEELKEVSERTQAQYSAEIGRCKEMALKLKNMEEELNDLKANQDGKKQASELKAELDERWKMKYEQDLALAKEKYAKEMTDLKEERDYLLELKVQQEQGSHSATVKELLERRVAELEMKLTEQESSADTAAEVKRVMNGVFHSLRGEFDLNESYSGQTVLGVLVNTIKNVTLHLLNDKDSQKTIKKEELADQEVETDRGDSKQAEKKICNTFLVNQESAISKPIKEAVCETKNDHYRGHEDQISDGAEVQEPSSILKEQRHTEALETTSGSPTKQGQARDDISEAANPDAGPHGSVLTEVEREQNADLSDVSKVRMENTKKSGEVDPDSMKSFGPPAKPPPPPDEVQLSGVKDKSLTGESPMENGETIFKSRASHQSTLEEEEEEVSLKGHPPPAPLLGDNNDDDDDDNDADWLS